MWTANLDKLLKTDGNIIASVTYTSDTGETQTQDIPGNNLTPDTLAAFVGDRIQALEVRDAAFETLAVGPVTPPAKSLTQVAELDSLTALAAQVKSAAASTAIASTETPAM
jgi:hypothetical protein